MKEQLIKNRDRLLRRLDKNNNDPSDVVSMLDVILRLNKEIRWMEMKEEHERIKNEKKETNDFINPIFNETEVETSLFPDLN